MPRNPETGLAADVHFRVPGDFVSRVHMIARAKGMTASNFMRSAIVDAMQRSGVQDATPDRDAA
jgi:predicted transcriptional regulator